MLEMNKVSIWSQLLSQAPALLDTLSQSRGSNEVKGEVLEFFLDSCY